jgi:hypothetical protein
VVFAIAQDPVYKAAHCQRALLRFEIVIVAATDTAAAAAASLEPRFNIAQGQRR